MADQDLTPEGCTVEEAAISAAEATVAPTAPVRIDRWTFEEGWRCGREYERAARETLEADSLTP